MRKIFCDICGKEINDYRENWNVSVSANVGSKGLRYDQADYSLCFGDVCNACACSIYHHIESLRILDNDA